MDPEVLLPVGLLISGVVGLIARRRARTAGGGSTAATAGQRLDHAGETLSRLAAAAARTTGRLGVDGATKLAAGAGAATSAAAGLVIDGGVATMRSLGRPVVRVTAGAGPGAGHAVAPGRPANGWAENAGATEDTIVIVSARGKRFHLTTCALAPIEPIEMSRHEAMATARRPCPTCNP